tara:strand:- start:3022 stop:3288 length:267 start_codon:yes stop_codon:yes gene_type:complete
LHYTIKLPKRLESKPTSLYPNTSQNKGTVENRIGLIRAFLPKKTDLNEISHETIAEIEKKINNRPIRKFNYLSPKEKLIIYRTVALVV